MAHDHGHSQPLYARVGNTEYTIAWLRMPVKSGRPIDEGTQKDEVEVVDLDKAAIEALRRRLGLQAIYYAPDGGVNANANIAETGQRTGSGQDIPVTTKSEAEKGKQQGPGVDEHDTRDRP
jgi:hypothetical protein